MFIYLQGDRPGCPPFNPDLHCVIFNQQCNADRDCDDGQCNVFKGHIVIILRNCDKGRIVFKGHISTVKLDLSSHLRAGKNWLLNKGDL